MDLPVTHEWVIFENHDRGDTYRMTVPGGFLYRVRETGPDGQVAVAVTFVPHRGGTSAADAGR